MFITPSFITFAFANFFSVCSFASFFLFPLFISDHGGSKVDIGIMMGIFTFSSVLCRPWISEMVDRIGRKRCFTLGCVINILLSLTYLPLQGDFHSFYLPLLLLRIAHGIGVGFCFTAAFTYVADIVPLDHLNEGLGLFGAVGLMGMAVGPIIAENVIAQFGFSIFFIVVAGLATLSLILMLPISDSYVPHRGQATPSFFAVLLRKKISILAFLTFLFGFGLSATGSFVSPFAKEQNITFISLYYICYSSAAALVRIFGGRFFDRIGEERVIPYALVITGTGLFILVFLGGNPILILSGFLTGLGHGCLLPCLNALAIRNEPVEIRGKITGVFTGGIDAGIFMGSILLGFIGEWAGFRVLFFSAALALFLGLLIFISQVKNNRETLS
ncbi:MFS transporter [Thermodesulfobacteriota bacterium]